MIILMNKQAERNQINLVMETLKKQNLIPIYIEKENAISTIKTNSLSFNSSPPFL